MPTSRKTFVVVVVLLSVSAVAWNQLGMQTKLPPTQARMLMAGAATLFHRGAAAVDLSHAATANLMAALTGSSTAPNASSAPSNGSSGW
mmetsp:Transcript_14582/g.35697  ORF Transcript_14582/g.35697 Transcript_14582/m.35697 type:complete len:89 (-) Transcript_14582:59-325(-)